MNVTSISANSVIGVYCPHCGEVHRPHYDHPQFLEGDKPEDDMCGVFFYCREYRQRFVAIFTLFRIVEGRYTQDFIGFERWTSQDLSEGYVRSRAYNR